MPSESLTKGWQRDVNTDRLGYFRTDDDTLAAIASLINNHIETSDEVLQLFDPCVGEGLALSQLANELPVATETWGVEIDRDRFLAAADRIDHCLHADGLAETYMSKSWADVCLFNPPYGDSKIMSGGKEQTSRLEVDFWERHAVRVARGGLMIAVLPTGLFKRSQGLARAMSFFFAGEDVSIFKASTDKYRQIVIIGRRRRDTDADQNVSLRKTLTQIGDGEYEPPVITKGGQPCAELHKVGQRPDAFKSHIITVDMAAVAARQEPANCLDEITKDFQAGRGTNACRTIMPLRQGHIPQFLAAGRLDGHVYESGQHLLVKGSVKRVAMTTEDETTSEGETSETTKTTKTTTYKWQTLIMAWDLTPGADFALLTVE